MYVIVYMYVRTYFCMCVPTYVVSRYIVMCVFMLKYIYTHTHTHKRTHTKRTHTHTHTHTLTQCTPHHAITQHGAINTVYCVYLSISLTDICNQPPTPTVPLYVHSNLWPFLEAGRKHKQGNGWREGGCGFV
jgi:hypothetical protein